MKEKLNGFYEKCAAKTQEERKELQKRGGLICGLILILSVIVSLFIPEGILSYIYIAVFLVILVLSNIFEKHTGWNLRYFKQIMLGVLCIAFVIIIVYGLLSGESFTN